MPAIAINTEEADLVDLFNIRRKVLIGKYKQKGRGVGADIEVGAEIAQKALSQIMDTLEVHDRRFDSEAFWIIGALGGGTGAGGSCVLAKELKETYNKPVYGLGILPSTRDMPGEKESLHLSNALRSFEWWRRHLDNILLVDNQQFERRLDFGEPIHRLYQRINDNLTQSLITILNAGEVRPAPQEVFNSSEIIETLGTGGDVSTIGHESLQIKLKTRFWEEGVEPSANQLERIIRSSADPRALTFPCDVSGARSASLITRGRPEHLYSQAIQKGKAFLEEVVKATNVRYGDYPDRGSKFLSATTILSKINDFTRLDQMRQRVAALT